MKTQRIQVPVTTAMKARIKKVAAVHRRSAQQEAAELLERALVLVEAEIASGKWRESAREEIAKVTADLPASATLKERRARLREHAPSKLTPRIWQQMWYEERRRYLEIHGQPLKGGGPQLPFGLS